MSPLTAAVGIMFLIAMAAFVFCFVNMGILTVRIFIMQFRNKKIWLSHNDIFDNPDYKYNLLRSRLALMVSGIAFIIIAAVKPAQGLFSAWYSVLVG